MLSFLPCKEQGVRAWTARGATGEGMGIQWAWDLGPAAGQAAKPHCDPACSRRSHELRISAGGLDEPQSG